MRPYPRIVDSASDPPEPHRLLPDAMRTLLESEGEGRVMVTTWVVACAYIDENGAAGVAAWSSDDPQWQINGLLTAAGDMLDVFDGEDEEIDDE